MVEDWIVILETTLNRIKDNEKIWEFTVRLKDEIEGRNIDAIHVVRGTYSQHLLDSANSISDGLKPEGRVRDTMIKKTGAKRIITKDVIAYHGYEQYYTDIFNRFYNRACRDSSYAGKFKIFKSIATEDKRVAKMGWDYGIKNSGLKSLDYKNKLIPDIKEKTHIRFSLSTFYKRVR